MFQGKQAMGSNISPLFDETEWTTVEGYNFEDITYHRSKNQGTVPIAFNRPECRNAFRPQTVDELYTALEDARCTSDVGCVLITGNGPSAKDGGWAFCSGGDQRIRGKDGYQYVDEKSDSESESDKKSSSETRPSSHPRSAAPHPFYAKSRHRCRAWLGCGRRTQFARRLRSNLSLQRARRIQADRSRRRQF